MRKLILRFLIIVVSISLTAKYLPGISYRNGVINLCIISVVFALINMFIKPIIKILTLPVQMLTLGFFSLIINAGMLLFLDFLLEDFILSPFWFPGISLGPVVISPFEVPVFGVALIGSIIIGFITTILAWLITD